MRTEDGAVLPFKRALCFLRQFSPDVGVCIELHSLEDLLERVLRSEMPKLSLSP